MYDDTDKWRCGGRLVIEAEQNIKGSGGGGEEDFQYLACLTMRSIPISILSRFLSLHHGQIPENLLYDQVVLQDEEVPSIQHEHRF